MDSSKTPTNPQTGSTASRRRSSGPAFDGLMAHKRSNDPECMARRASLHDQKPQAGFFGTMWNNFTRGPSSPTK
ncbi:Uu.00g039900.m01.CDS01 [Anthostomella pinea]|uniref:Uu.00g039900.m01.CDS01 n=1 Tax=Anthostomella pinea TaxID=933095 RepID=A0AAI8YDW5_9PEZI|nr:Uu.00g039900.m01.CDS01 [Anthostomella pinea]